MVRELVEVIREYKKMEMAFFSGEEKESDAFLAGTSFFTAMTFRLPAYTVGDRLIGFREGIRTFRRFFSREPAIIPIAKQEKSAVIGSHPANSAIITEYISRSSGIPLHSFISKDRLISSAIRSTGVIFRLIPFAIRQAMRAWSPHYRVAYALSIREIVEIAALLDYAKKNELTRYFDFIPYEKDGNFLSLMLRKHKIFVVKIPSPGPLTTHNRIIIGDEVVFSSRYHFEEYEKIKSTIRVKKIHEWIPERAFRYIDHYKNHAPAPPKTIGYYSHGEWLRKAEGHTDNGRNTAQTEPQTLSFMAAFVKKHPEFRILIFPHPKEKVSTRIADTKKHYEKFFGTLPFELAGLEVNTADAFDWVDIALVTFSTTIYERLFCGYKVLINHSGIDDFPLADSPLRHICFTTAEELEKLILKNAAWDDNTYFERNHLIGYRLSDRPHLVEKIWPEK